MVLRREGGNRPRPSRRASLARARGVQARGGEAPRAAAKGVVAGESGGILALIANPTANSPGQWLYLIDTKKRSFAIYRVGDPSNSKGTVKLEAARQFRWDLELDQYNNQGLEPADVKARVDSLNQANPNP